MPAGCIERLGERSVACASRGRRPAIPPIHGNLSGLKASQLRRVEKLLQRRIPPESIVSPELARQLSELSHEIARQVGVLIDRRGRIEYVTVGDARSIQLPDFGRVRTGRSRFRGLRCVHTHLAGEALTDDDLADLAILRLDLMASIEVHPSTGLPGLIRVAHLLPVSANGDHPHPPLANAKPDSEAGHESEPWAKLEPRLPSQLGVNFLELIESLEEEFRRADDLGISDISNISHWSRERAILVHVTTGNLTDARESIEELTELTRSCGVEVVESVIQRRPKLDPRFLLGHGKLQELVIRSIRVGASVMVFDQDLSPAQSRSINRETDLKILDRTQLILDIFAQRAQSREGKIQVELAQLKYLLPRLVGAGVEMSRLMGGIGGRGPGETKLEVDRRRARERIHALEKQIEQLRVARQNRRSQRTRRQIPVVSIVGYTNAGKSTLLNALTGSQVLAEQRMFATLDPASRRLRLPREREIIINDTVGFLRDLPKDLMAAFRATLEELQDSDLLVHVVDATSHLWENHIRSVRQILAELNLAEVPEILVFNKCDLLPADEAANLATINDAIGISALQKQTLLPLVERIGSMIEEPALAGMP